MIAFAREEPCRTSESVDVILEHWEDVRRNGDGSTPGIGFRRSFYVFAV